MRGNLFTEIGSKNLTRCSIARRTVAAADSLTTISRLNGAAVVTFQRHVIRSEGHSDEAAGFAGTIGIERPKNLQDDATVFIGSCKGLLRELREFQSVCSELDFRNPPPGYAGMRAGTGKFYRSGTELGLSEED
jgi:hypothetical protein